MKLAPDTGCSTPFTVARQLRDQRSVTMGDPSFGAMLSKVSLSRVYCLTLAGTDCGCGAFARRARSRSRSVPASGAVIAERECLTNSGVSVAITFALKLSKVRGF